MNNLDILAPNAVPVNYDFVIILRKETSDSIEQEVQKSCKILKFNPDWNSDDILSTILRLESLNYPNLFIFIIEVDKFGFLESIEEKQAAKVKILLENLHNFNKTRPMVLQLKSKDENVTKFYYKDENSDEFHKIKEQAEELTDFEDFPTFLWLHLRGKIENFEDKMLKKLLKIENPATFVRFLRILELSEDFWVNFYINCAAQYSNKLFLAVIDEFTDTNYSIQGHYPHEVLLRTALNSLNHEIVAFLLNNCKKLLKNLSILDQITISETAHDVMQIEVLCDLLELFDFPFPELFFDPELIGDERLFGIVESREKFHKDVLAENLEEVEMFLSNNPSLKFAYNIDNKSAMAQAVEFKKFNSFFCLMDNLFTISDTNDVKMILSKSDVLSAVICSELDVEMIEEFVNKIEDHTDSRFVNKLLKVEHEENGNLLFKLAAAGCKNIQKFRRIFQILGKFLNNEEILELVTKPNIQGLNVLHFCAVHKFTRQLLILLKNLKSFSQKFNEIVNQRSSSQHQTIIHHAAEWNNKEHYQSLWNILQKSFDNREELMDFIMQKERYENNFVHYLVSFDQSDALEFFLQKIRQTFNDDQYRDILKSKASYGRTILQYAVSQDIKTLQTLWKIIQNYCKNDDEILEFLTEVDTGSSNCFELAVAYGSCETIKFIINEVKNIANRDEIKKILQTLCFSNQNLIQTAARENKSAEMHKALWTILQEFLCPSDIFDMIAHNDEDGRNQMLIAVHFNTKEIVELTWNEVREVVNVKDDSDILDLWIEAEDCLQRFLYPMAGNLDPNVENLDLNVENLDLNVENLDAVAENLDPIPNLMPNYLEDQYPMFEAMLDHMMDPMINLIQNSEHDSMLNHPHDDLFNFIPNPMHDPTPEHSDDNSSSKDTKTNFNFKWIEFVRKYRANESSQLFKQILQSNIPIDDHKLLHKLTSCDNLNYHESLWNLLLKNRQNLKELLLKKDEIERNFIHHLIINSTIDIIKFTLDILKEHFNTAENQEILNSKEGRWERNLLQTAAAESKNVKIHQILWTIFRDFCESDDEFFEILNAVDKRGSNVFHLAASHNSREIFEFMINYKFLVPTNEIIKKIFSSSGRWKENLLQSAAIFNHSKSTQEKIWEIAEKNLTDLEIRQLIISCDCFGDNLFHGAAFWNTKEVVEVIWMNIKKYLKTEANQREFLIRKGQFMRTLEELSQDNQQNDPEVLNFVRQLNVEYNIAGAGL